MRTSAAILAALLLGAAPAALPLALTPGGRVLVIGDGEARFGWPGVYFEGRFRGTAVKVGVASETDFFRVLIDGREHMVLKRPQAPVTIAGLSPGEHLLRIEKMTESQTGGGRLLVVDTIEGGTPLPPPRWKPQVEFIGDSYTVGYGNTSPKRDCTGAEVHDTTDTQQAFGPLVAKRLGYDYRVIAYSGFGIVRNYDGNRAGETMPLLYPRMLPDDAVHLETQRGRWRPKAIVINLGTNDFSTPLHPGEAWANADALHAAYRAGYTAFARRLMAAQPQARLVLMGGPTFAEDVEAVAKGLRSPKVRTVRFDGLELGGCQFHPSLKDHARLAELLAPLLK